MVPGEGVGGSLRLGCPESPAWWNILNTIWETESSRSIKAAWYFKNDRLWYSANPRLWDDVTGVLSHTKKAGLVRM
jgi:hypothetical protein